MHLEGDGVAEGDVGEEDGCEFGEEGGEADGEGGGVEGGGFLKVEV